MSGNTIYTFGNYPQYHIAECRKQNILSTTDA